MKELRHFKALMYFLSFCHFDLAAFFLNLDSLSLENAAGKHKTKGKHRKLRVRT